MWDRIGAAAAAAQTHNGRMIAAGLVGVALLAATVSGAQRDLRTVDTKLAEYIGIVDAYRAGDRDDAVRRVMAVTPKELSGDVEAAARAYHRPDIWGPGVDARVLVAAAMLHTDAAHALWPANRPGALQQLNMARFLADTLGSPFGPRWYLAAGVQLVIDGTEIGGGVNAALDLFDRACLAFPADVSLLVAGAWMNERTALAPGAWQRIPGENMLPRLVQEKRMFLDRAVRQLSAAVAADPSAIEARLRLGRVRLLLGDRARGERELSELVRQSDLPPREAYLVRLLLGSAREQAGDVAAAGALFREATRLVPGAASARFRLAASQYAAGETAAAAEIVASIVGADAVDDPWREYLIGHLAVGAVLLDALRDEARR
jgi:tetratricopeptide (TPR) repeat protein